MRKKKGKRKKKSPELEKGCGWKVRKTRMLIERDTVIFKSNPLCYERERDGQKPNTTCILDVKEWDKLVSNCPDKVRIVSDIRQFERKITDVSKLWQMFDKVVVTISWQHGVKEED
jgi:hypothetical protein